METILTTRKLSRTGFAWVWVTILVITIDRFSKHWVNTHLMLFDPVEIFSFFNLTLAHNKGAAFSFLHAASGWQNLFLGSLAVIISIVVGVWLYKLSARERWMSIALCLILSGALGNAWDRVLYGYVIDFLHFHWHDWNFAIFNIADSAISVGAFMVIVHWVWREKW